MPRPRAQVLAALLLTQLAAFVPKAQRRQTVKIKSESDGRLLAVKAREAELRAQLARCTEILTRQALVAPSPAIHAILTF